MVRRWHLLACLLIFTGCETIAAVNRADIIAAVAVATANVLHAPTSEVPREGCEPGCKCNGTGKEETGDGLAIVPCRCDDDCECKAEKSTAEILREPPLVPVTQAESCENGSCNAEKPAATILRERPRRWRLFR